MQIDTRIQELYQRWLNGAITSEEIGELSRLLHDPATEAQLLPAMDAAWEQPKDDGPMDKSKRSFIASQILERYPHARDKEQEIVTPNIHSIRFLKTTWFRYAAAILILITGLGAYFFYTSESQKEMAVVKPSDNLNNVAAPSASRATLTLANGQKIFLDSVGKGLLAVEGNVKVRKTSDGQILYDAQSTAKELQYNTLAVPRGSQIASIVLSDGSRVYLNAASSLIYPVAFNSQERKVEVVGEAYFEIAKDARRKFVVVTEGIQTEVLGTHFNINAYPDESDTRVTLIEGSVRVSASHAIGNTVLLRPGQQALLTAPVSKSIKVQPADIDKVMAWKNGAFNFNETSLKDIMKQFERWYDIEVIYESSIPNVKLKGEMSRGVTFNELLLTLKEFGVHYRQEGRKLILTD